MNFFSFIVFQWLKIYWLVNSDWLAINDWLINVDKKWLCIDDEVVTDVKIHVIMKFMYEFKR